MGSEHGSNFGTGYTCITVSDRDDEGGYKMKGLYYPQIDSNYPRELIRVIWSIAILSDKK